MAGYADILNARRGNVPVGPPVKPPAMRKPSPMPRAKGAGGCPHCGGKLQCKGCGKTY